LSVLHAELSFQTSGMWLWKTSPEDESAPQPIGRLAVVPVLC